MKGAGGAASGGLKSDKEDREEDATSAEREQKQGNFERVQGDKEKTTEALRKLYGDRGEVAKKNADTRASNPSGRGNAAWNKPPHERYKDARKLIQDERKAIMGSLGIGANPAERAAAQKQIEDFERKTLKQYGLDAEGNDTSVPSATPSAGKGTMRGGGSYQDPHIPTTQEDFDRIPPGGFFINPSDGEILRKKGQKTSALGGDDYDSEAA
jgi:hypothetical protein